MHHRIPRIVGALTGAVSLTVGLLVPVAVASPAPLDTTQYSNLSPGVVNYNTDPLSSPINLGGFELTATNTSTSSNISQLYLTNVTPDPTTPGSWLAGNDWLYGYSVTKDGQPDSSSSCSPVYPLGGRSGFQCSVGPLNAQSSVTVTLALIAPTSTSGSSWSPTFLWSTNGDVLTGTGQNQSRSGGGGYDWSVSFTQTIGPSGGDSVGTFVWDSSQQSLSTNQAISKSHTQSAQASLNNPNDVGIPFSVSTGADVQPTSVDCAATETIVANWTRVNANNDVTLNGQLHTTIVIYHGPSPNQVNGVCWVHYVYTIDPSTNQPYGWTGTDLLNAPYADGGALCSTDQPAADDPAIQEFGACVEFGHAGPNLVIQVYSDNNGYMGPW